MLIKPRVGGEFEASYKLCVRLFCSLLTTAAALSPASPGVQIYDGGL